MTQITIDEVKKLAQLAKLSLTDAEAEKFRSEMDAILEYVAQLNEVDTTGVKPTSQVTGLVNSMRKDEVVDYGVSREDLLKTAPDSQNSYVKVKKVL